MLEIRLIKCSCSDAYSGRYLLYAQSGAALSNVRHLLARNSGQSQRMIPAMVNPRFFKLSTDPDFEVAVQGGQHLRASQYLHLNVSHAQHTKF